MKELIIDFPVNKMAALVVSKTSHRERDFRPSNHITSMAPLPTKPWFGPIKDDLTGVKSGRFTVIGCALFKSNSPSNSVRWVVRCTCGRYQMMSSKSVKKNHPKTACVECKSIVQRELRKIGQK